MDEASARRFAGMARMGITREYPNAPGHIVNGPDDVQSPRRLHPAFYGCFDWHSAVHGHWMLARLLRRFPHMVEAGAIRQAMNTTLSAANLQAEADYFAGPNHQSFERPYGWAWLLKLAEELHDWQDADGAAWSQNLGPLVEVVVDRALDFLPKQAYPIRVGTHANTAFGLAFALDYARTCDQGKFEALLVERSRTYFADDRQIPAAWEPGGNDFLSPALVEADLMARVLAPGEFAAWFAAFLPGVAYGELPRLLDPVPVGDHRDPQLVHLDGLHLSRAWCMVHIAAALPQHDPARPVLLASAERHAHVGLAHVASGDYMGEHWLASFAVYMLTS